MSETRDTSKPGLTFWLVMAAIGVALAVWGAVSGSLAFTLAPAVLTVGCVWMAVRAWRRRQAVAEPERMPSS